MVKVRNLQTNRDRISRLRGKAMYDEVSKALFVGGNRIQTTAQKSITEGSVSGKFHVPSLPGEPPNADTHTLDRQIETAITGPLKVEVSSNAPYAAALEFGTSRGLKLRPYMGPAAAMEREAVVELVRDAVNRVVNDAPAK